MVTLVEYDAHTQMMMDDSLIWFHLAQCKELKYPNDKTETETVNLQINAPPLTSVDDFLAELSKQIHKQEEWKQIEISYESPWFDDCDKLHMHKQRKMRIFNKIFPLCKTTDLPEDKQQVKIQNEDLGMTLIAGEMYHPGQKQVLYCICLFSLIIPRSKQRQGWATSILSWIEEGVQNRDLFPLADTFLIRPISSQEMMNLVKKRGCYVYQWPYTAWFQPVKKINVL